MVTEYANAEFANRRRIWDATYPHVGVLCVLWPEHAGYSWLWESCKYWYDRFYK